MTYSMVAHDPETGTFGVAVQSHFFGVGRIAGWARAGVGAVVTQAAAEKAHGPGGLELLAAGRTPREAVDELMAGDPGRESRQLAMVGPEGDAAAFTGDACISQRGHRTTEYVSAQGNMLVSDRAWHAMVDAYEAAHGDLAERLLAALDAAEATGGDARGRQSASLLVVSGPRTERAWDGAVVDVRVDDHPDPLVELRRLVGLNRFYDRLLDMLKDPGLLTGTPSADPERVTRALDDLAAGERLLGDNQEATMWRGVLLARTGRTEEGAHALREAIARRPELEAYLRQMTAAGDLPAAALPFGPPA
jgi:uncharacterized Ntn-hydrolase superfamily protein